MKRTLVLAVDRDDDFGVKGKVTTPVVGLEDCISAANALGIADPEDSDLNAIYAAISTCMDLLEEGVDAEVALICGDEKVGHKSDLAIVAQLEAVLDDIKPDNVVLIGDGAEDEYIYPIISSRAHVDSVRKVFVKQAPNIESSLYILTKMMSEPNKRKRFITPIAALILIISLFILVPDVAVLLSTGDISSLPALSRDLVLFLVGLTLLLYAYSFTDKWDSFNAYIKDRFLSRGVLLAMTSLALGIVFISLIICYYEVVDTYYSTGLVAALAFLQMMVWPVMIAFIVYVIGVIMDDIQGESVVRLSNLFDCFSIASLGMVLTGMLDVLIIYLQPGTDNGLIGVAEIALGIMLSLASTFFKKQYMSDEPVTG